mgnify:FL=1
MREEEEWARQQRPYVDSSDSDGEDDDGGQHQGVWPPYVPPVQYQQQNQYDQQGGQELDWMRGHRTSFCCRSFIHRELTH